MAASASAVPVLGVLGRCSWLQAVRRVSGYLTLQRHSVALLTFWAESRAESRRQARGRICVCFWIPFRFWPTARGEGGRLLFLHLPGVFQELGLTWKWFCRHGCLFFKPTCSTDSGLWSLVHGTGSVASYGWLSREVGVNRAVKETWNKCARCHLALVLLLPNY